MTVSLLGFSAKFAPRFMAAVAPTSFIVFGHPDERVKQVLTPLGAVYRSKIGGFFH